MTTTRYAHSAAAANGRALKAIAIADVLDAHGATAAQAAALDEPHQLIAATLADKPKPSPDTWSLVVKILADRAAHVDDDPFAGLPA